MVSGIKMQNARLLKFYCLKIEISSVMVFCEFFSFHLVCTCRKKDGARERGEERRKRRIFVLAFLVMLQ